MKKFATITVIGQDKTGVIAHVTNFLFEQKANIEALEEQVTRGQFSMTLQASWSPANFNARRLQSGLKKLGRELSMEITLRFTDPKQRQRFAIMVTRESHCLIDLMTAFKKGRLNADPCLILGSSLDLKPLATQYKIPFHHVPWNQRVQAEIRALKILQSGEVDFVVLARFMKILSPNFVWRFKNKVINIHPSLLPSFPGPQAYRQAYESGVKIVGVTAHFVTMHLDEGPIIAQNAFPIKAGMNLKDIVQKGQSLEAKTLTKAVQLYLNRKLDVYWGKVKEV
jgi:formyltetrahydrofolate deformylase